MLCWLGLGLMIIGHARRFTGMFKPGGHFALALRKFKPPEALMTETGYGPYSFKRHSAYYGWFLWSIGTQLLLHNYICLFLWLLLGRHYVAHGIRKFIKFVRRCRSGNTEDDLEDYDPHGVEGDAEAARMNDILARSSLWSFLSNLSTPVMVQGGACLMYMISSSMLTFLNKTVYTKHNFNPVNLFII